MNAPLILTPPAFDLRGFFGSYKCRPDVSNEDYHRDRTCVSCSGLKQILRSPAHYQAHLRGENRKETPTMALGTAIHTRLLEPYRFFEDYIQSPHGDRRSKKYKNFVEANPGKHILTPDQWLMLEGITQSVSTHKSARSLLLSGLVEHTLIWEDPITGIWLKIRPDNLNNDLDDGICTDIKSTEDASSFAFGRSSVTYDYDLQAAMYLEGLRICFGRDFDFCFLAIEKEPPYGISMYGAPATMLERGLRRYRYALNVLANCRKTNKWPGYQPDGDFALLDWPSWAT